MASAAQITANQHNATLSTGPVSEAGKQTSSRNAMTHGLTAKQLLLSTEQQSEYEELRDAMREAWRPKTGYEQVLFDGAVRAHWFWTRAQCAHTAFLDAVIEQEIEADPKLTPEKALARLFLEDKYARRLALLMRYEGAAERTYRKSLQELERTIAARLRVERLVPQPKREADTKSSDAPKPRIGSVSQFAPYKPSALRL